MQAPQSQATPQPQQQVQSQPPKQRILVFNNPINTETSNRLRVILFQLLGQQPEEIIILFSSSGGGVDEGIALYNFLNTFPVTITMHAVGVVASIAIPVFLAATNRFASTNARFFFHDFTWAQPLPTRTVILEADMLLKSAFEWTTDVYKARTQLTDVNIREKNLLKEPCIMRSSDAEQYGIVQKVSEPSYSSLHGPIVVL